MRVSIEKGYQPLIRDLMARLKTDDPKLAVHHIIGCWASNQGCEGIHQPPPPAASQPEDEFSGIVDWS